MAASDHTQLANGLSELFALDSNGNVYHLEVRVYVYRTLQMIFHAFR